MLLTNHITGNTVRRTYDLVDDFAGSLDDFLDYLALFEGDITLTVPAGTYGTNETLGGGSIVNIIGAGVGVTELQIGGVGFGPMTPNGNFSVPSPDWATNPMPRIATVSAGATSVTLLEPLFAYKFKPGHWTIVSGVSTQLYGYPPNLAVFEYVKIASANPSTGVVTFETPLVNSYKSYWPDYPSYNQFASDLGGAAMIWPILNFNNSHFDSTSLKTFPAFQGWAQDLRISNCTIRGYGGGLNAYFGGCRKILWEDCDFPGYPPPAGGSQSNIFRNCTVSFGHGVNIEVDKLVDYVEYDGCNMLGENGVQVVAIGIQSASTNTLYIHDCINFDTGTSKVTAIEDCTVNKITVGPAGYGYSTSLTIDNCTVTDIEGTIGSQGSFDATLQASATLSNGIITVPISEWEGGLQLAPARFVPGSTHFISRPGGGFIKAFRVLDYASVGSDIVITTDLPEPCPEWDASGGGAGSAFCTRHPCPDITVTDSVGCGRIRVLSRAPANLPIYSYYHSGVWDGVGVDGRFAEADRSGLFGQLVSITVNVTKAYTGVLGTTYISAVGGFGTRCISNVDYTNVDCNPLIDSTVVGTRIITPGSTTGAQPSDIGVNLDADAGWIFAGYGEDIAPRFGANGNYYDISNEDPSVWPSLTIEIVCDQGL